MTTLFTLILARQRTTLHDFSKEHGYFVIVQPLPSHLAGTVYDGHLRGLET